MIVTLEFGNDGTDIKARDHLFVFHFFILTKSMNVMSVKGEYIYALMTTNATNDNEQYFISK